VPRGAFAGALISIPDVARLVTGEPHAVGPLTILFVLAQYLFVGGLLGLMVAAAELATSWVPEERRNRWRLALAVAAVALPLAVVAPGLFSGARISQTFIAPFGPFLLPLLGGVAALVALKTTFALKSWVRSRGGLRAVVAVGSLVVALVFAELMQLQLCRFRAEIGIGLGLAAWVLLQLGLVLGGQGSVSLAPRLRSSATILVAGLGLVSLLVVPSNPTLVALARAPVASDLFIPLFVRAPGVEYGLGDPRIDRMFDESPTYGTLPAGYHPPGKKAHLVFVVMDALRADRWEPAYREKFPTLVGLRGKCVTFASAFAPGAGTRDAVSAILRGRSGTRGGPSITLEMFSQAGYRLGVVAPARALELIGGETSLGPIHDQMPLPHGKATGDAVAERALAWMREHASPTQPVALWIHFFSAHDWSAKVEPGSSADRYDRGLVDDDGGLKRVLEGLRESGMDEQTVVVVFGDHGEALGANGWETHKYWLYREIVHVPLAFCVPGMKPHEVTSAVGTVSIGPTLRDLFGFDTNFPSEGASLVPLMEPGAPSHAGSSRPILMEAERQLAVVAGDRFVRFTKASRAVESMPLSSFLAGDETNLADLEAERTADIVRWIGVQSPR